ncbi:hypothetical protein N657DRAFT_7075 [Parathielavia appendiculata]|uniref:Uncharacterized protein n=1 Tax=Parathielavia appendiculata TaxID=2587402 RepID=A0AAN6U8Y5_9PEZI|nr:hypothetical protein N657DRAFT_7075 [Parathielavia appendiculata]
MHLQALSQARQPLAIRTRSSKTGRFRNSAFAACRSAQRFVPGLCLLATGMTNTHCSAISAVSQPLLSARFCAWRYSAELHYAHPLVCLELNTTLTRPFPVWVVMVFGDHPAKSWCVWGWVRAHGGYVCRLPPFQRDILRWLGLPQLSPAPL